MDNMLLTFIERIQKEFPNLKPNQEDSDDWLNEANALLRANQLAEAEQKFKACMVAEPDFHRGFEGLAEIYRQRGRVAEARYFAQQALMRARRFINDGSMDQVVFDEIYAAYKSTDTQAYAGMTTTALVAAMAQSMKHPDDALLHEILNRGAEAVPPLIQALRDDTEVTYVSDFAAQLLTNLKLNGVDEADEAVPQMVDIFRRIDEDFLDFLTCYLQAFGEKTVRALLSLIHEGNVSGYQLTSVFEAAIAAADGSSELQAEIAGILRERLAGHVSRREGDDDIPYVSLIIGNLLTLRDQSALPLMREAFDLGLVDESIVDETSLRELDKPYEPTRWTFDQDWLKKHELSLLNAVHRPDRPDTTDEGDDEDDEFSVADRKDLLDKLRHLIPNLPSRANPTPYVAEKKPGRNDLCWCGSGKKYKHCHLREDEAKAL